MTMFTVSDRARLRERVLELAHEDARVVAAAEVGSLALAEGDRWSDLDLTFGIAESVPLAEVLRDWTDRIISEFDAAHLFDLTAGTSLYRVFLLPGCLQFDLSFTPASQFGATGPRFKLLFGIAVEKPFIQPPPANELFGYAVHHAVRARICIERERYWQAEYWLSGARDYALSLACRRRGLSSFHGRGFDDLPAEVRDEYLKALPTSMRRDDLLVALGAAVDRLLREAADLTDSVARIGPRLRELLSSDVTCASPQNEV
jgi:hypothetical protein